MNRKIQLTKRVLYNPAKPISFVNTYQLKSVAEKLAKIMLENNGIGIAAPQCGLSYRMFLIYDKSIPNKLETFCNPTIKATSDELVLFKEGCLSFPGEYLTISRPADITVEYQNIEGEVKTADLSGIVSRCFQHEYDHLDGVTFQHRI